MNKYHKPLFYLVCFYGATLLAIASLPYWPAQAWVYANLISFSPLWLYALPLLMLAPLCLITRQPILIAVLIGAFMLCIKLSGWVFNVGAAPVVNSGLEEPTPTADINDPLVVITANMGGNGKIEALNKLIVDNNADLIALQEISAVRLTPMLNLSPLNSVCIEGLCLLSHLELKLVDSKPRVLLGHSGRFVMQVKVGLPAGAFDFYVLHLNTPREGFEALIANPLKGWRKMADIVDAQMTESWVASSWAAQGQNAIVAGDFNLPMLNPIYEKYWHWLTDSFQEAGSGLGYTKHTRLHGIQIDHILHSQGWSAAKTWIGPSLGGDHLPVITILSPSMSDG
ncbi:MAG: endonuclease/exonuclease/phosphatase family protein [Methylococcales bacterium]